VESLNQFELELLENLPVEPIGLSLAELADGLLDNRSPRAKGQVRLALDSISKALGGLNVTKGNDDFGAFGVPMYGMRRDSAPLVRTFLLE